MTRRERLLADPETTVPRPPAASTLFAGIGVTLLVLCADATVARAVAPTSDPDRPLRVATGRIAPFVIPEGGRLTGFSIDLWNELARRLRVESAWTDVGPSADQIQAVRRGDADVAISAITITQEREKVVDFSHPYFDSGLQAAGNLDIRFPGDAGNDFDELHLVGFVQNVNALLFFHLLTLRRRRAAGHRWPG